MNNKNVCVALLLAFLAVSFAANVHAASAYGPQKGDYFKYSETVTVNNGSGSYLGYSDQTQVTGMEQMNSISGNNVSTSYSYSYQYSDNQGSSASNSSSGSYAWSSSTLTYVNGTDNQVGSNPLYVWFAMNPSLPVGATFYILNSQFTVLSKNYSLLLPTEGNKYVQTVETKGTGQYQRNDSYGVFNASYTWYEYFDPTTGYIVGYFDLEQDNGQFNGQVGGFTYNDTLYVTQTSYNLALASPPASSTTTANNNLMGLAPYLVYIIAFVVILFIIVIVVAVAATRRRGKSLPKHPYSPSAPPPSPPPTSWESKVDLGSKPSEQVVVRDVAKVNCKYCGALIPTTVDTCPFCGAPRQ